jgi:hypothetical protein
MTYAVDDFTQPQGPQGGFAPGPQDGYDSYPPGPHDGYVPEPGYDQQPTPGPDYDQAPPEPEQPQGEAPPQPDFILYKDGEEFGEVLERLGFWVHNLLVPVYAREVSSGALWCTQWWRHPEAVAQLHGLSMAWQEMTGAGSNLSGPAMWHRDFLGPVMQSLRDPSGPFAGCKPGSHRDKPAPPVEQLR